MRPRRWHVIGAYGPPNDTPIVYRVEQALEVAPKGFEVILLGDLNVRLQETCDAREVELVTVVAYCRMVDMTANFMPRMRYIGEGLWAWQMRR